jgi:starch-binding outer membrane protein, SusD/RagB family
MEMRYSNYKYSIFVLVLSFFVSCDVLDQAPEASLAPNQVFTDATGANAAIIGAYSSMQSANYVGLRTWSLMDLYSGNLRHTGTFPSFAQFVNRNILADNVEVSNMWNTIYSTINRANNIIEFAPGVNDASFNKDRAIAEAKVIRAFSYLNALVLWGGDDNSYTVDGAVGIPLRLKPTLTPADGAPAPKATFGAVKDAILADLSQATIDALPARGTGSAIAVAGRATKEAATALKARAQLIFGNYADAATLAQSVITGTGSDLTANFGSLFSSKNNAESLWELQFDAVNSNSIAFFFYGTAQGGRNEYAIATAANFPHEANDTRTAVNNPGGSTTLKYTVVAPGTDNVIIVRKGEMYLTAAEALVRQSAANLPQGLTLLNRVRTRAGLPNFVTEDAAAFFVQLAQDRRNELAFEGFPNHWVDLRRTGQATALLANANRVRLPIPQREVLTSENVITQNAGY